MDWNRNGLNGVISNRDSNQYLPVSTSSTVSTIQSTSTYMPQRTCAQAGQLNPTNRYLKKLLVAKSSKELLQVQQSAIRSSSNRAVQMQQVNQMSSAGQYSSYKPHHETVPTSCSQSALNVQGPATSNYLMVSYTNSVPQTPQQPQSVPAMQQYESNGYNVRDRQMPVQNGQASVGYVYQQQNVAQPAQNVYSQLRQPVNTAQTLYQQVPANQSMYSVQNANSGPYVNSHIVPTETNVPVNTQTCRNSQTGGNYITITYANMLPQQVQTAQQPNSNSMNLVHRPQRPLMPAVQNAAPNSSQVMATSTNTPAMQMPPPYVQAITQSNVLNGPINPQFANQNYVVQNAQQPIQSAKGPQDQCSAASSLNQGGSVSQERSLKELFMLCQVYKNAKQQYILLNHENNRFRQKLQAANASRENASPISTPLICTLQTVPTSDAVARRQNLPQSAPVQNPSPLPTAHGFPAQNAPTHAVNVPAQNNSQTSQTFHGNMCFPNQVSTSSDRNVLDQNNYLVFDGGQMNSGNSASSTYPAQNPDSLNASDLQNVVVKDSMAQANNQCLFSGSSGNGNVSQNQIPVDTLHSRNQTNPVTSERSNTACPSNSSHHYDSFSAAIMNAKSNSREAIEASLRLWKSVPQVSPLNKDGATGPEGQQRFVDLTVEAFNLLEETLASKNETTSVASALKPELSAPKSVAVVSPLVQSKDMVNKEYSLPKVVLKDQDQENHSDNITFNLKESDCLNKLLQALQSIDVAPLNIETSSPKERPPSLTSSSDNVTQSLPSSAEVSSPKDVEQNFTEDMEMSDNDLQISGVCTLVEGNSFYDSSIAMIFDKSVKTEGDVTFPNPDAGDDCALQQSELAINTSCFSEATDSSSLHTDAAIVAQPSGNEEAEFGVMSDENLHGSVVQCFEMQNDQNKLSASDSFCELDASPGSDQLSELLTAFPFGIKNYMAENKLEAKESVGKLADKPVIHKVSIPFQESPSTFNNEGQNQDMSPAGLNMCTLAEGIELGSLHEPAKDLQPIVERVPTPTEDDQTLLEEISLPPTEDCFDLTCDSPVNKIQITLLDQDEIPNIFPVESEQLLTPKCEEIKTESYPVSICTKESKDPMLNVELSPLKKENSVANDTTALTDKDSFCCLFSWLNKTNGNAPKCNCRLAELPEADQPSINSGFVSEDFTAVVTESLGNLSETSLPNSLKAEVHRLKDCEIQPHNGKLPKLNPVEYSSKHKSGLQSRRCSPQEDTKVMPAYNLNRTKEGLKEKRDLTHEKSFQSSAELASKPKDHLQHKKTKSNDSHRSEKLIVNMDFRKNKHLKKEKRKYTKRKNVQGGYDTRGNIKKMFQKIDELEKSSNGEIARGVKSKQSSYTTQHTDHSMNKSMPSLSLARSTPTHSRHKRDERVKNRPESHFDKMRKVPTVQEYLERKRELCNKRSETGLKPDVTNEGRRTFDDKLSLRESGCNSLPNLKRPLSPAKMNTSSKTRNSESDLYKRSKDRSRSSGSYEIVNDAKEQMRSSSKDKIYLSPCIGSRGPPFEGLSLTKLQIRCSPEKHGFFERRRSESSLHRKSSKSEVKKTESPKMLEFKLCPEFVNRSPATQEKSGEPKTFESKSVVEGIKSKKEAWCSGVPFKKRRLEGFEDKGGNAPSVSTISTPSYKPIESRATRPVQDSRTTFNVFKQMYHEQRSKSLDSSLGNS